VTTLPKYMTRIFAYIFVDDDFTIGFGETPLCKIGLCSSILPDWLEILVPRAYQKLLPLKIAVQWLCSVLKCLTGVCCFFQHLMLNLLAYAEVLKEIISASEKIEN
jgi:hypothetical protein